MCPDLFSEETFSGSILVNGFLDHTKSSHLGCSLTGGSTVSNIYLSFCLKKYETFFRNDILILLLVSVVIAILTD